MLNQKWSLKVLVYLIIKAELVFHDALAWILVQQLCKQVKELY